MKKFLVISIVAMMLLILPFCESRAQEIDSTKLVKMRTTAYCLMGKTYTGEDVREGICATGNKEYIGKIAVLYHRLPNGEVGELIGEYEVLDTGCSRYVIDVWCPDLNAVKEYAKLTWKDNCNGKVFVEFKNKEE